MPRLLPPLFDISPRALKIKNESSRIRRRSVCKEVIFIEFRLARVEYWRKYVIIHKVIFSTFELLKDISHNRENDIEHWFEDSTAFVAIFSFSKDPFIFSSVAKSSSASPV
jgi:hypothetical protein